MGLGAIWEIMKFGGKMMIDPIGTGEALADEVDVADPRPKTETQKKSEDTENDED